MIRRPYLIALAGEQIGTVFAVTANESLIGGDRHAQIRLQDVSLRQARLIHRQGEFVIEEIDEVRPIRVNGAPIAGRCVLRDGDRLAVGRHTILKFALLDEIEERYHRLLQTTTRHHAVAPVDAAPSRASDLGDREHPLRNVRGFILDCDGCLWTGDVLSPHAAEALRALERAGRDVVLLSNNSQMTGRSLLAKLRRLGVELRATGFTPVDIIGGFIRDQRGRSRVLVLGAPELADAIAAAGHVVVDLDHHADAEVVVVGRDPAFDYARLSAASQAISAGALFVTPNLDARLPLPGGFAPGCGAIVEAIAVASGVRPIVLGKPEPYLFHDVLKSLGLAPTEAVMIGDSIATDIAGAHAIGMPTVLYAPPGSTTHGAADFVVSTFAELARLAAV